jgi:mono/diheme cytochrome c family protein
MLLIRATTTVFAALLIAATGPIGQAAEEGPSADQVRFFEAEVRPVLAANCFKCHGQEKQKGGLRLDAAEGVLRGGDSGPAVVPGKPVESLLIEAINHEGLEMPPGGQLPAEQRAALTRWVEMGAPWPGTPALGPASASSSVAGRNRKTAISDEDRAFWSLRPLDRPEAPAMADDHWSRNPIDRFVIARLAAEGLDPAPEADSHALIRRLFFDLTGLPPSPGEVEAFVAHPSRTAYEALVDRLLASPRYGERWARHWLDLVRYAESDGYNQDAYRPNAWRYRDYVIRSFNGDKPYDRFVLEQLAGDEIAPGDPEMMIATSYYRLGTYEFNQSNVREQFSTILNDITDVSADVFLGLSVGCARCHDHKFDPILQKDYYRLQAFFAPLVPHDDQPLARSDEVLEYQRKLADWEELTAEIRRQLEEIERPHRERLAAVGMRKVPPDVRELILTPIARRTPAEQQLVVFAERLVDGERARFRGSSLKGEEGERWQALQKRMHEFDRYKPDPLPTVMTAGDVGPIAPRVFIPGDRSQEPIEPGFLTVLDPGPARIIRPPAPATFTGRRTTLARWLIRPGNPLASRVLANRIWQYHFGKGLVGTSSDFGRLGDRPSHPELLDWLATEIVARGWSFKELHRLIVTSSTYRQTALRPAPEIARLKDPENRLLWRMNTRRLDAEQIREAMLAASGELDLTMGGEGCDATKPRRTIYTKVIRNKRDPLLGAFDAPDGSLSTAERHVTTIPTQALLLLNGPWSLGRAQAFAQRLRSLTDAVERVSLAYQLAFGRSPTKEEEAKVLAFLDVQDRPVHDPDGGIAGSGSDGAEVPIRVRPVTSEDAALIDFCHALLNANEFLYVD